MVDLMFPCDKEQQRRINAVVILLVLVREIKEKEDVNS